MYRVLLTVLAVLALSALATASAQADGTSGVITSASFQPASPATAGSGDNTTAALSLAYSDSSDTAKSLSLTFAPGFLAAPAAVSATCSTVDLAAAACPTASEIGTGNATVATVIGNQSATLSIYLMPAPNSAAIVGVGVVLNANVLGIPITTTTSGSATFITGTTGQPQLQITLPSLPSSVAVPVVGSVAIQLTQLTMTLTGQAPSGSQFIYLPTNCSSASTSFAVSTDEGASGSATASFTPTGCPLAYSGGQVSAAAQVVDTSFDAAFQTSVSFPTGGANTTGVAIAIPSTALRANPIYAGLSCPTTAPFSGCTQIGTVTATTPLLSSPLSGTAYLTGSVAGGYGLGLLFPAPINLALSGTVGSDSGTTEVIFSSVPDLPLTTLELNLTGSDTSAFQASCGAGTQTLIAALTGAGGAGTITKTTAITVAGCPASSANGGGSQVADYGTGSTPKQKTTPPRLSTAKITNIAGGHPVLTYTVKAGSAKLRSLKLALPSGLRLVSGRLNRTVHVSVRASHRVSGQKLIVTLKNPGTAVTVRIGAGGLSTTAALKRAVRTRRTRKVRFKILVGASGPTTKLLSFTLNALRT